MVLDVRYTAKCAHCRHHFETAERSTFLSDFFIAGRYEHCPGCARTIYRNLEGQIVITKIVREWVKVPRVWNKPSTWLFAGYWNELSRDIIDGAYKDEK